jgi:hypothetical protein
VEGRGEASEDLLALVSLARVINAESSYPDVLALAGAQVRRILGRGTCALYVAGWGGEQLVVEHAAGPLAAALRGTSIRVGQKLTGWVAAHRRTIVNSDAQLDLADVVPPQEGPHTCLSCALHL